MAPRRDVRLDMPHKISPFGASGPGNAKMAEFKKTHHGHNEFAKSSFSELVSVTGPGTFLFLSGIGAEDEADPAGSARHPGDMAAQCSYAFDKARRLLTRHGAGMGDIVKITAYDYSIYGGLKGELVDISADALTNEKGETFYRVKVRTPQTYLERKGEKLEIIPGMVAAVNILTGKKSVMEYLLKPFIKTLDESMGER